MLITADELWEFLGIPQWAFIFSIIMAVPIFWKSFTYLKKHFKKKKKNPYCAGQLVTGNCFVGREKELARLKDCWEKKQSVNLIGEGQIGKTSLLHTWQKALKEKKYPIICLNGQDKEGVSFIDFLQTLMPNAKSIKTNISADEAANRITDWANLYPQPPVIFIDKCESIIKNCPPDFWVRMRGLSTARKIIWCFGSRQSLSKLYKKYHYKDSPFDNSIQNIHLGLLNQKATKQLIQRGKFSFRKRKILSQWAGSHPFYLQLLGNNLFYEISTKKALNDFLVSAKPHLTELWKNLSVKEQQLLAQAAYKSSSINNAGLHTKGITTNQGNIFAKVFIDWIKKYADELSLNH